MIRNVVTSTLLERFQFERLDPVFLPLPEELIFKILSNLRDDEEALFRFSEISRSAYMHQRKYIRETPDLNNKLLNGRELIRLAKGKRDLSKLETWFSQDTFSQGVFDSVKKPALLASLSNPYDIFFRVRLFLDQDVSDDAREAALVVITSLPTAKEYEENWGCFSTVSLLLDKPVSEAVREAVLVAVTSAPIIEAFTAHEQQAFEVVTLLLGMGISDDVKETALLAAIASIDLSLIQRIMEQFFESGVSKHTKEAVLLGLIKRNLFSFADPILRSLLEDPDISTDAKAAAFNAAKIQAPCHARSRILKVLQDYID